MTFCPHETWNKAKAVDYQVTNTKPKSVWYSKINYPLSSNNKNEIRTKKVATVKLHSALKMNKIGKCNSKKKLACSVSNKAGHYYCMSVYLLSGSNV